MTTTDSNVGGTSDRPVKPRRRRRGRSDRHAPAGSTPRPADGLRLTGASPKDLRSAWRQVRYDLTRISVASHLYDGRWVAGAMWAYLEGGLPERSTPFHAGYPVYRQDSIGLMTMAVRAPGAVTFNPAGGAEVSPAWVETRLWRFHPDPADLRRLVPRPDFTVLISSPEQAEGAFTPPSLLAMSYDLANAVAAAMTFPAASGAACDLVAPTLAFDWEGTPPPFSLEHHVRVPAAAAGPAAGAIPVPGFPGEVLVRADRIPPGVLAQFGKMAYLTPPRTPDGGWAFARSGAAPRVGVARDAIGLSTFVSRDHNPVRVVVAIDGGVVEVPVFA